MKILVVGSLPNDESMCTSFKKACEELGAAIVNKGWELVVGSDRESSADFHFLKGASNIPGVHKIHVIRPDDGPTVKMPEGPGSFKVSYQRHPGHWAVSRIPQVQAANLVLIIAGRDGALQTGYAAFALNKPTLTIGSFGGAAAELWSDMKRSLPPLIPALEEEIGCLNEEWKKSNVDLCMQILNNIAPVESEERKVSKTIRILSIDGGGIRGLIPSCFLNSLEQQSGWRIHEMFDLVAGTSTGGILALGLTLQGSTGQAKYTATDMIGLYKDHGKLIFPTAGFAKKLSSIGSSAKYSPAGIESVLDKYFGVARLSDSLSDVIVTSYDIQSRKPFFLKAERHE